MGKSLGHLLECKLLSEILYPKIVLVCSKKTTQRVNVYLNETSAKLLVYEFAYIIIFSYLYSMKQQLSSLSFADLLVCQRKVKQTFLSQIDKIIDWNPIRGIIEIAYTKHMHSILWRLLPTTYFECQG